jgi:hypothetical protein
MLTTLPIDMALDVGTESLNDVIPPVAVTESPAHAGLLHALVTISEDLRVLLDQNVV